MQQATQVLWNIVVSHSCIHALNHTTGLPVGWLHGGEHFFTSIRLDWFTYWPIVKKLYRYYSGLDFRIERKITRQMTWETFPSLSSRMHCDWYTKCNHGISPGLSNLNLPLAANCHFAFSLPGSHYFVKVQCGDCWNRRYAMKLWIFIES